MGKHCCRGKTGLTGAAGVNGRIGDTGATGSIGPTGAFGATTFTWLLVNSATLLNSNTLLKLPVGGDWNSGAYSVEGYTNGAFMSGQANALNHYFIAGFTDDNTQTQTQDAAQINYGWFLDQFDHRYIMESGHIVLGPTNYTTSETFQITYDGINIYYLINGTIVRTVARTIGLPLYLAVALGDDNVQVNNIHFGPQGQSAVNLVGAMAVNNSEEFLETKDNINLPLITDSIKQKKYTIINLGSDIITINPSSPDTINHSALPYTFATKSCSVYASKTESWIAF